ncbi:MAG: chemotaxis protein CheB, partial [Bryobacteraceae bacterium]
STYTCPECGGTLWQIDEHDAVQQFRCHVGHAYAPDVLLSGMSNHLENALWGAVRALVERANLRRQLARRHRHAGNENQARSMEEQAAQDDTHVKLLRERVLEFTEAGPEPNTLVAAGR